jgi:integrase
MGKAAAGSGSTYFDKKGKRWVGEVKLDGKRRRVSAKTEREASTKLREMIADHERGIGVVLDGKATVGSIITYWIERELPSRNLAESTLSQYEWMADLWRKELGNVRLRALTVDDIERALDRLAAGSQGRKQGQRTLTVMRQVLERILDVGIRRRAISTNPAIHARFTPKAAPPQQRRSLTEEEADTLWEACETDPYGALWRLMLATGLRPGEAVALRWDALNLDAEVPTVNIIRSARATASGKIEIVDDVKTAGSYRTIELSPDLVQVLKQQRLKVTEQQLAASVWNDQQLVFPNTRGGVIDRGAQARALKALCRRCRIDPIVRPHELRHSTASLLSAQGVPHEQIADLLGHESTQMLDRVYRHRLRKVQGAAAALRFGNQAG